METRPFDLQPAIRNYFNRLHVKANLTKNDELELESHIQEGIDSLVKKGLSTEEAFLITINRMGEIDVLSGEYNKVNPFFISGKIRLYSMIVLGLILSFGTVFLLLYELISMYSRTYLTRTTADTIVRLSLFFGASLVVLAVFKWGKLFSVFLQKCFEQKAMASTIILFLLPLFNFILQPVLIKAFNKRGNEAGFNYKLFDIGDVQFINLSFYLLIISVLLLTLVSFWSFTGENKVTKKKTLEFPIIFLILFGILICLGAAMMRYIPENNSGLQNAFFLATIYAIGSFAIAFYKNDKFWLKLIIFSAFGLFLGNMIII